MTELPRDRLALDRDWDVIVIGTGMGGGTIAYTLSKQGFSVLMLEKGLAAYGEPEDVPPETPGERLQQAYWPEPAIGEIDGVEAKTFLPLGCGAGGSTMLYGAALERLDRIDFEGCEGVEHPTGGWPISYDLFRPWYEAAEALYKVHGTRDPLHERTPSFMRRPPPASEQDQLLMQDFALAGLHPYRLHVGIAFNASCRECVGKICPLKCKSDAKTICVDRAVENFGATLLSQCEVTRIEASQRRVTEVKCQRDGMEMSFRARAIILSAGTYRSAALMLQSANEAWPKGLGNHNGLVGRNLMFHATDWFAVWPRRKGSTIGYRKTIGFRDFYCKDGVRLGSVQSTGLSADYGNILAFLRNSFDRSRCRRILFLRPLLRIPAKIASKVFGKATIFAMIIEDKGEPDNRLVLDQYEPSLIRFVYRTSADLKERVALARQAVRERLATFRKFWINSEIIVNLGHPTGTCRFGTDASNSVLDPDCRVHGLENLYVVDGSFLPTSGGTNPSLTIAANALRVGDMVGGRLRADA